jgi:hypothetical protein
MTSATLWIEITIAGSVYLFALFFVFLRIADISDLTFLTRENALLPYIAIVAVGTSYVLGIVAHRWIQVLGTRVLGIVERELGLKDLSTSDSRPEQYRQLVTIWQHGSERLHKEFDFQFALQALFRSLLFSIPFLGGSVSAWLSITDWNAYIAWVVVATGVFETGVFLAYRRQREQLTTFRDEAFRETDRIRTASPAVQDAPAGTPQTA